MTGTAIQSYLEVRDSDSVFGNLKIFENKIL